MTYLLRHCILHGSKRPVLLTVGLQTVDLTMSFHFKGEFVMVQNHLRSITSLSCLKISVFPTAQRSPNSPGRCPGPSLPSSLIHHSSASRALSISQTEHLKIPVQPWVFHLWVFVNWLLHLECLPGHLPTLNLARSSSDSSHATDFAKPALIFPRCESSQTPVISLVALHLHLLKQGGLLSFSYNHLCISDFFDQLSEIRDNVLLLSVTLAHPNNPQALVSAQCLTE